MDDFTSPFHAGEIAMQRAAGVHERMCEIGPRVIRDRMPDQHREFFEQLPTLLVGSVDESGRPWASMLSGWPGFIGTPDARHLRVDALPAIDDPLHAALEVGAPLGLLGLEPTTRRRNRLNGTVIAIDDQGFELRVEQSFGNCPQYIQARAAHWVGDADDPRADESHAGRQRRAQREGVHLSATAHALIERADTVFIASATPGYGADVSHRGGKPGFVRVDASPTGTVLTMPDFRGNFFFNTLGNIAAHPKAGVLVVDHETGGMLQLTGGARIIASGPEVDSFAGAQRLVRIEVDEGWWSPLALPLRWGAPEFAPQLTATGHW